MRSLPRIACVAAAITLALIASGCGRKYGSPLGLANQPPSVTLSGAPAGSVGSGSSAYALHWTGADPDGRVDHYLVSTDSRQLAGTQGWTRADENGRVLSLLRLAPARDEDARRAVAPTFFAVRAVDDRGAVSEPAVRAFFADNVAPEVQITQPAPNPLNPVLVPPTIQITWQGIDPDGRFATTPVKYKYLLLGPGSVFPIGVAIANPDSLRRYYAPGFAGWDSVSGDTLAVTYTNLIPNVDYLFALVGFDEQGDYSPVFSLSTNMLRLRVVDPTAGGPRMTVWGGGLFLSFTAGGVNDAVFVASLSAPERTPVEVHWSGVPSPGTSIVGYRWAIDIADVTDETPRANPSDVRHWSTWSPTVTAATVSAKLPAPPAAARRLTVEALSSVGFKSRVSVNVAFVNAAGERPLLIVNDTRLQPEGSSGGVVTPIGNWPNSAELDSFLVARGGVQVVGYPAGSLSLPGLFTGYDFDVFRTRDIHTVDRTVSLDLLMRYKNVVWITDANAALASPPGGAYSLPYMSSPGRQNTLVAYANAGGRLWFAGGGAALAMSKFLFNSAINDVQTFTYSSLIGELVPGRPMYDVAHWRSEFSDYVVAASSIVRLAPAGEGAPDYSGLPITFSHRAPGADPIPPLRTATNFFPGQIRSTFEYLTRPNPIVEGLGTTPGHGSGGSVLDTLFTVRGVYPPGVDLPFVTVYRGSENGQVVFMGADLWSWSRPQMVQLIDVVLGNLWHLPKTAAPPVAERHEGAGREEGILRR